MFMLLTCTTQKIRLKSPLHVPLTPPACTHEIKSDMVLLTYRSAATYFGGERFDGGRTKQLKGMINNTNTKPMHRSASH